LSVILLQPVVLSGGTEVWYKYCLLYVNNSVAIATDLGVVSLGLHSVMLVLYCCYLYNVKICYLSYKSVK